MIGTDGLTHDLSTEPVRIDDAFGVGFDVEPISRLLGRSAPPHHLPQVGYRHFRLLLIL